MILDFGLVKTMTNQVGLAQTTRRNQCHIITVGQQIHQSPSLLYPVTKVTFTSISVGHKWIIHVYSTLIFAAKI